MAEAMAGELETAGRAAPIAAPAAANKTDASGMEHGDGDGKFEEKGGYSDVKDMMAKAETVDADRVSAIQEGFSGKASVK